MYIGWSRVQLLYLDPWSVETDHFLFPVIQASFMSLVSQHSSFSQAVNRS